MALDPQPSVNLKLTDAANVPANYWQGYLISLDRAVRALASGKFSGVSAVNDADAASQGVGVGFIYESGGALRVRKV
jgi:hypothetical protein